MTKKYIGTGFFALGILFYGAVPVLAQVSDDYGTADSSNYCPRLSVTMQRGARDSVYSGQVSELQKFISDYYDIDPNEIITGFFGRITQGYVQRFQREQGLPPFGIMGSMTRASIARVCTNTAFNNNQAPTNSQTNTDMANPTSNSTAGSGVAITSVLFPNVYGTYTNLPAGTYVTLLRLNNQGNYEEVGQSYIAPNGGSGAVTVKASDAASSGLYIFRARRTDDMYWRADSALFYINKQTVVQPSCTIGSNKPNPNANEPFLITWSTTNISSPVLYEQRPGGGHTAVEANGSRTFIEYSAGTATFQIGGGGIEASYNPICSVTVRVNQVAAVGVIDQGSLKPLSYNPVITGTANVSAVGISLSDSGGKLYGSGSIPVSNGTWSNHIGGEWATSNYTVSLYSYPENVLLATVSYVPPSATINQFSLTSLAINPTITGNATGVSSVGISISQNGEKVYGSGSIPVSNGTWSHRIDGRQGGSYTVQVYSADNILLSTATFNSQLN